MRIRFLAMQKPNANPKAVAKAEKEFDAIAGELAAEAPVERVKMMGMPSLKAGGKMFAGISAGAMTFKLGAGQPLLSEALKLKGARLFDPSGMNRPMKDWVQVPVAHSKRWREFARAALEALGS
jgi:hypothetical protein